jgi:hypothetical protein
MSPSLAQRGERREIENAAPPEKIFPGVEVEFTKKLF